MRSDCMEFLPQMERIDSNIMDEVLKARDDYKCENFEISDIKATLSKDRISLIDLKILLCDNALVVLEDIARKARELTRANFGNSINFFTPLYISNYCDNACVYCGFGCSNKIKRVHLNSTSIEKELIAIKKTGLNEILLLTGESQTYSTPSYIANAAKLAKKYFSTIGAEVYPMDTKDYKLLHENGVDFVTIFNETYSIKKYQKVHISGNKRVFPYRFNSQERALLAGMKGVGFGALLGLDDYKKDAFSTALHASLIQKKYPHAQISISVPRLRPTLTNSKINPNSVDERRLLQIICAYRIFLPFASITISTRESAKFRNAAIQIAANKISAGVSVGIGTHDETNHDKGSEQFEISDSRSVKEVYDDVLKLGLQPVFKDYEFLS
ncbi:2-iminoacetate synthase ThiH [Campylobacter corcagiensis]|uniref:2-iminoacetate synthase ThiH n=1 Tax=Campylobacter corcagiensis TaxID=1448857 RepID=A0A7M1LER0_9BACT|nr:2-iminoacetate synthase ThiH [Campylobacter corcagiensis]QOQ87059.1 2-iminoacetate synthase ThiH [Campylobacter corcagiensis]